MTALSGTDRRMIDEARKLTELRTTAAITERFPGWGDTTVGAYAEAFGVARYLLGELAAIAERLGDEDRGGEDTRRLAEIREVLKHFDWEHHDRQLALEAIERIAEGGQA